ncbi:MAG: lipopolysaccharide core heptose(I) kinase RfaP, partial [Chitinophagaceae bacterium]
RADRLHQREHRHRHVGRFRKRLVRFQRQAELLNIGQQVKFIGGRNDIATILQTVDVLLHPAYRELAGNVILEAMSAAKPVVVTDVCGYAHYVSDFDMGEVIQEPYEINKIAAVLKEILQTPNEKWKMQSEQFLTTVDAFSRQACVVDILQNSEQEKSNVTEWSSDNRYEKIILRDEMISRWSKLDVFNYIQSLVGPIAREFPDRQTLRFEENGRGYYRKLHRGVGWKEIFKNLLQFRLPILGAKNEWLALNKLRALDIPSLVPVAYGQQKASPAKKKSFIVTRELTNVVQLDDFFRQVKVGFREKTILLRKVAKIVSELHASGINHRDLYFCHFMLDTNSLQDYREFGREPIIYLVDLHRAQIRRRVPFRWLVKDLSGLYFSSFDLGFTRNDYFRFMRDYWKVSLATLLIQKQSLLTALAKRAIQTYK